MGESFDQCEREVEGTEDADGAHTLRMIGSLATTLLNVLQLS
jgi:hypothetical protein